MSPTLRYDRETNAAYIRFSHGSVSESEEVTDGVVLDFDAQGRIVGMEVLDARRYLAEDLLTTAA